MQNHSLSDFSHFVDPAALIALKGDAFFLLGGPIESLQGPDRPMRTQHSLSVRSIANLQSTFAVFEIKNTERTAFDSFITVGRTANNDVVIPDITVSKMHALIQPKGGGYTIMDGGSSAGTFVNERPVPTRKEGGSLPLRSGDAVRVGAVPLTFLDAADLLARAKAAGATPA